MTYMTPSQLRARDYGIDLTDYTDAQLAAILARSAADLHTYTAAPQLPQPHDFRGGTITGETHTWAVIPYEREPTRRVFLYHRPVLEITTSRIYSTKTQYVEFSPTELYYEPAEGWYEPASANLTSYGLWGAAMAPFIGLTQPHSYTDYSYGYRIARSERLHYSDTGWLWRATTGSWSTAAGDEPVVDVNGVTRPPADYTIDYIEGTVQFIQNYPVDGDTVDAEYVTTLHPDIAEAQGMISAGRIAERPFAAAMGGLRRLTVAELTMERGTNARGGGATRTEPAIPQPAADLLEPFIFRSVVFA